MEMISTVTMMMIKNTAAVNAVMNMKDSAETSAALQPADPVHAVVATAAAALVGVLIYMARHRGKN